MGEESALRARMKIYHCREMPWLKDEKRYLNPQMWAYLYHLYRNTKNEEFTEAVKALLHDIETSQDMVPISPTHITISSDEEDNEPPARKRLRWDGEHCTLSNGDKFMSTAIKTEIVNVPNNIAPCDCTCIFRDNHILMYDECNCYAQKDCMHAEYSRKCCACPLACKSCAC